jgi:hypothetical protein
MLYQIARLASLLSQHSVMTDSSILGSPRRSAYFPLLSFLSSQSLMLDLGIVMTPKISFQRSEILRANDWLKAMSVAHVLQPAKIIDLDAVHLLPEATMGRPLSSWMDVCATRSSAFKSVFGRNAYISPHCLLIRQIKYSCSTSACLRRSSVFPCRR